MALFGRGARPERRGTPYGALVVGLGNPGRDYDDTRHNVGFDVIDELARRHSVQLKSCRDRALVAEVRHTAQVFVLAKPTTYMNNSGQSVGPMARRYAINEPDRIVIVHDELDLEPGVVRVKVGGGLAGHNGLRSITQQLKTQDYVRIRIGVGKPRHKDDGADHVLTKMNRRDRELFDHAVQRAADAVELVILHGADTAMQQINAS
jgi:PTH1 family peptidyl-tRNA hydrolase